MRARTLRVAVGEDNVRAAVAAAGVNTPPTAAAATAFSLCCSRLFSVARTHVHATNSRPTLTVRTPLPDHGRDLAPPHTLNEPRSTRQTPIFNYTLNANRFFCFNFIFCFDLYFYVVYCYHSLYYYLCIFIAICFDRLVAAASKRLISCSVASCGV